MTFRSAQKHRALAFAQVRAKNDCKGVIHQACRLESLEDRTLLSASYASRHSHLLEAATPAAGSAAPNVALLASAGSTKANASASPIGYTPAQIRTAYGVNGLTFGSVSGDGSGQTIAIIDAYSDPNIASDLHAFDAQFGLADPSLKIVNESGGATLPPTDPAGPGGADWELETSLDVEWAHAMAPGANLLLVECNSSSFYDLVQNGVNWARKQSGVSVISMSFGSAEYSGETSFDAYFTTPSGHNGVTFVASTGDNGSPGEYPAYSPNVVAVGGTTLRLNGDNTYQSETAWSGTGGGISTQESQPSYQKGIVTQSTTKRATPDVSFDADPASGVAVYDSYDYPSGGSWIGVGGTSLSAPAWAGLIADADQARVLAGKTTLDGKTQTLPALYAANSADFHDVTTGNNGGSYGATAGYDPVTGRGSPVAQLLLPALAGVGSISGTILSADGSTPLANQTVYLDVNNNGAYDAGEPTTTTDASGNYSFTLLSPGSYTVRQLVSPGWLSASAPSTVTLSTSSTLVASNVNFTDVPTTFLGSGNAADQFTLRRDSTGQNLQVFLNASVSGTPTFTIPVVNIPVGTVFTFNPTGASSTFTMDFSNGDPLPTGASVAYNASGARNTMAFVGGSGNDTLNVTGSAAATFDGAPIALSDVQNLSFPGGSGGSDQVNITSGTWNLNADTSSGTPNVAVSLSGVGTSAVFDSTQRLASLSLANHAFGQLASINTVTGNPNARTHTNHFVLAVNTLSIDATSKFDLVDNDLIINTGSDANAAQVTQTVAGYLAAGRNVTPGSIGTNGSAWNGATGLVSSAASAVAAANSLELTALGLGNLDAMLVPPQDNNFAGVALAPGTGQVLVKYTYFGDATLDGWVGDNSAGLQATLYDGGATTGHYWYDGSFDGSGKIDDNNAGYLATFYGAGLPGSTSVRL